jgi:Right handed beta helix region
MRSYRPVWLLISMLAILFLAPPLRADDMASDEGRGDAHARTINLSHDLVKLGIASSNLSPDSPTTDARPLFQATLLYAQHHAVGAITVDHGAYYFLTPQDGQAYLRFSSLSNLTVDLADSAIHFATALIQGFNLTDCTDVTLTRFRTEYLTPPYTHVQLSFVDPIRRSLAYATLPDWADPVTFNGLAAPNANTGPVELWAIVFRNGDIVPATSRMHVVQPIANGVLQLVQDNTPWTQSATLATLDPGDTIVLTARGGFGPITVVRGDRVTISDATIQGSSAIAVLFISSSHSIADRVRVIPRASDLIASNADGIHLASAGADNHIRHSFVTRTMDDALAIDSRDVATVVSQTGSRQLTVNRTAFLRFPNGTAVTLVDPVSAAEQASATIVSQTPPDSPTPVFGGQVVVEFDRDLPTVLPGAGVALADPAARGAGSSIEDNVAKDIVFGRGIWIAGAEQVRIERNEVGHTSSGGIVISHATINYPTPAAHHIVIRDNVVRGSLGPMASGSGTQIALGGIMVASTNDKNQFPVATASSNITIERNRILDSGRTGIWIGELGGGLLADNVIIGWDRHPELPLFGVNTATRAQLLQDFTQPLVVNDSENVVTRGNTTRQNADQDE